jgi:hypothetical protein
MQRILTALVLLVLASTVAFAQRPGENRYQRLTPDQVFTQPKYNGNPSMLDGYGKKTAGELGLAGKEVYNEYPTEVRVVILSAQAVLYYDTASMEIVYLDGCRWNGREWKNRVKLVTTTVTVTQRVEVPIEREVVREVPREVIREVPRDVVREIPCPECPVASATFDFRSTLGNRLLGVFKEIDEWGPSVAVGALGSGLIGDGRDAVIGGAASFGANWAGHVAKPDPNRLEIDIQGKDGRSEEIELKRGESRQVSIAGVQGVAYWQGDQAGLRFPGFPDCVWAAGVGENYILTPVIIGQRDREIDTPGVPPKHYVPPGPGAGSGDYKMGNGQRNFSGGGNASRPNGGNGGGRKKTAWSN